MRSEIVKSKVACPKCRSNDLFLTEVWNGATICWEQIDGEFDKKNGSLEPGDPHHVEARCKACGHTWRIRGAKQIDDVY